MVLMPTRPKGVFSAGLTLQQACVGRGGQGAAVRVHVLRTAMVEPFADYLGYYLADYGLSPSVSFGQYQDLLLEANSAAEAAPDAVCCLLTLDWFVADWQYRDWQPQAVADRIFAVFDKLGRQAGIPAIANTILEPCFPPGGMAAVASSGSVTRKIRALNTLLCDYAEASGGALSLIDWNILAARLGEGAVIDSRMAYAASAPFRPEFLNQVAWEASKQIRILRGRLNKCLVLDCDNTLWGGVVGESGPSGIALDPVVWPGRAYHEFQKSVLAEIGRGTVVALCSKNNEADVWQVIDSHPHCLLRREHIAAARINWQDKPQNIAGIAEELNLSLDSLVFLDDSPFECDQVRTLLPGVTVVEVPGSRLSDYPTLLGRLGLFDGLATSAEDRVRSRLYQDERRRRQHGEAFADRGAYLGSLGLKAHIHPAAEAELGRVAQLTQKTNQFNLTTRRYSEAEIRAMAADPACRLYSLTAEDKFGSYGLTGVLIARRQGDVVDIEALLLSCRILGRQFEDCFVAVCLADLAAGQPGTRFTAAYLPTAKNGQTARFWDRFAPGRAAPDGVRRYAWQAEGMSFTGPDFIEVATGPQ